MWSIYRKKSKPAASKLPRTQLRWTIRHENASEYPDHIRKVYEDKVDGFIFRSFFSEEQCKTMLEGIANTTTAALNETPFGRVVGKRLDEEDGSFQKLTVSHWEGSWPTPMPWTNCFIGVEKP